MLNSRTASAEQNINLVNTWIIWSTLGSSGQNWNLKCRTEAENIDLVHTWIIQLQTAFSHTSVLKDTQGTKVHYIHTTNIFSHVTSPYIQDIYVSSKVLYSTHLVLFQVC